MKQKMKARRETSPNIATQKQNLLVFSLQQHQKKKEVVLEKSTLPLQMSHLKGILTQKIKQLKGSTCQINGFTNTKGDILQDYKLQIGLGIAKTSLTFVPFHHQDAKNLKGLDKYIVLKCIGVGGFSKVYLCRSKQTAEFYAAKFIEKSKFSSSGASIIRNEIQINQEIKHPFLVKMEQFIETQNFYILMMEYCPGGELFNLLRKIKRMEEDQARHYFIEIMLAIEYLQSQGIVYRDLKPENIMLDLKGHCKITDFGLAKRTKEKSYSFCGSLEYMSPEIILAQGHSFEVDYYCLGILLYQMVIGCPPFYEPNSQQNTTKLRIIQDEIEFPDSICLSKQIKHLITALLEKDPSKRLGSMAGVKEIKFHPWVGWFNQKNYIQGRVLMPFPVNLDEFNFDPNDLANQHAFTCKINEEVNRIRSKVGRVSQNKNRQNIKSNKKSMSPYLQQLRYSPNNRKSSVATIKNKILKTSSEASLFRKSQSLKNKYLKERINYSSNLFYSFEKENKVTKICERLQTEGPFVKENEKKAYDRLETQNLSREKTKKKCLKKKRKNGNEYWLAK